MTALFHPAGTRSPLLLQLQAELPVAWCCKNCCSLLSSLHRPLQAEDTRPGTDAASTLCFSQPTQSAAAFLRTAQAAADSIAGQGHSAASAEDAVRHALPLAEAVKVSAATRTMNCGEPTAEG